MKKITNINTLTKIGISSLFLFLMVVKGIAQPTYCTPTNQGSSCMTNVTFNTLNYTSAGCENATTYYNSIPVGTATTTVIKGLSYVASLTLNGTGITSIWIDYNQNGLFETTEWVQPFTAATSGTANITIPATAISGLTGMRVRSRLNGNQNGAGDACLAMGSGETEDFYITIVDATACTGTPTAGNTISNFLSVCPLANFMLSLQNPPLAGGITYQWQSSPDNITYTNIAGATNSTYTTTQSTNTYYQCIVTCTAGPTTVISNPLQVTMNPATACYCTSIPTSSADEEIFSVTINGSTNAYNCTTVAPGVGSILNRYSNFQPLGSLTTITQGASIPFTVLEDECDGATYYSNGCSIWIDFNQNGSFADPGEQVYVDPATIVSPRTIAGFFTVPITALPGVTGMRIIVAEGYSGASLTPCLAYGYGETEDYLITIASAVGCSGTPAPGNTLSSATLACPATSFTLTLQNPPLSSGITYQWQSSPDNITFTNIPGATNPNYTTTQSANTYYQCVVTCTAGPSSATSSPILVTTDVLANCFCTTPVYTFAPGCGYDIYINDFQFGGISNTTGCNGTAPYYTYYSALTATLTQNVPAPISISSAVMPIYITYFKVYIDFNDNGSFEDAGELVYNSGDIGNISNLSTGFVTVPLTAPLGTHRMRVRCADGDVNSCTDDGVVGEVEDYNVTIIAQVPCAGTPIPGNTTSTSTSVCSGTNFTLSFQNLNFGTGVTLQWQSSPDNITYSDIVGETATTLVTSATTDTYYQCVVTCTAGPSVAISTPILVSVVNCINMTSGSITTCSANFYDSGGPTGSYQVSENYTYTIYPNPGNLISVTFNSFNTENSFDGLSIFDGPTTGSPLISSGLPAGFTAPAGSYYGTTSPGTVTSTDASGALTFQFVSDGSVTYAGWDAVVTCIPNPPCTGTPNPGNTLSTLDSVCAGTSFILSLQNNVIASAQTFQWQSSPDGITWTNIAGATSQTYTTTQIANTYYQCIVTCTTGPNSGTSTPIMIAMNSFLTCYCTSTATVNADEEIFSVTVNGVTNAYNCTTVAPGPGSALGMYSNFTTLGPLTTINPGATVPFTVLEDECDGPTYYNNGCGIWIDFNQNGLFTDPGEQVYSEATTTVSPRTISGNFTVPAFATTGTTLMRVIVAEGYSGTSLTPCLTYGYGETEDYLINIGAATYDMGISNVASPLALHCYTSSETISVTVKNFGADTLDMSVNTVTVNCAISGSNPNNIVFTPVVLNTGLFLPGTTQVVTFSTNYDMSANGTYIITSSTTVATDGSANNDSNVSTFVKNTNPTVTAVPDVVALCAGQSAGILATPVTSVAVDTLFWSPGAGLSAANIAYPLATPSATTTYTVTVVDALGCTATDTALLTIHQLPPVTASAASLTPCIGSNQTLTGGGALVYFWDNGVTDGVPFLNTALTTTTYNVTGMDQFGCTNTASLTLTVNPLPVISVSASANPVCANTSETLIATGNATTYVWDNGVTNGLAFGPTATTNYHVIGTDANGCSSPDSILVNVNQPSAATQTLTACNGGSVTVGTNVHSVSGTYIDVLTAANGCDSTVTTNLTVSAPISGSQTLSVCAGANVIVGTNVYITSGNYTDILTAANGCDSTVTTNLTVNPAITGTQTLSVCSGASVTVGSSVYSTSGTYTDILTAANSCDSTVTTILTVNSAITSTQSVAICAGGSYIIGTSTYTAAGTYTDVLTAANSCDSTVTTNLTVNPTITGSQSRTICAGDSVVVGTSVYTAAGTYTDVLTTAAGCDSTLTTSLTVTTLPAVTVNSPTICVGDTASLTAGGATTYTWTTGATSTGVNTANAAPVVTTSYTVTGTSGSCSNTAISTVNVNPVPTVTLSAFNPDTVCAQAAAFPLPAATPAGGIYTGAAVTGTNFVPSMQVVGVNTITYSYTANGCLGQAFQNVVVINCLGVDEYLFDNAVSIYPNPTSGMFTIAISNANFNEIAITVVDVTGREVYKAIDKNISHHYNKQVSMDGVAKGIYYIKLSNGTEVKVQKLVIE